jgi:hypothetical protein
MGCRESLRAAPSIALKCRHRFHSKVRKKITPGIEGYRYVVTVETPNDCIPVITLILIAVCEGLALETANVPRLRQVQSISRRIPGTGVIVTTTLGITPIPIPSPNCSLVALCSLPRCNGFRDAVQC